MKLNGLSFSDEYAINADHMSPNGGCGQCTRSHSLMSP